MSIKVNFAYRSLIVVSFYLMSFISFPYISRIFGVANLGLVNFVDNTVNYFLLFATMGINVLGVREIAATKSDPKLCCQVFANVLGINLLFTAITLIIYLVIVVNVPKLSQYSELFYIGSAKIVMTAFMVEWFFTGIENFRYIAIRSIAIRACYIAAIFIFIRQPEQYRLYWWMSVAVVVINAVVNMAYAQKYIDFKWQQLFSLRYMKSNITLGIYAIMTSMYLTFNVMYLGLVSNNTEVGYYTTAFKLYSVVLGFFTAFANVMLPRMSALIAEGDGKRFEQLIDKSFAAVATFSTPIILCSIILAPQIIFALAGKGYEGAILPMQIIMPAIVLVGASQVMTLQVLMPMKKDRVLLYISIVGAAVSLMLNLLIIKRLQSVGSAIVLLSAEVIVTLIYIVYLRKNLGIRIPVMIFFREFALCLPSTIICIAASALVTNPLLSLAVGGALAIAVWCALHPKELKMLRP